MEYLSSYYNVICDGLCLLILLFLAPKGRRSSKAWYRFSYFMCMHVYSVMSDSLRPMDYGPPGSSGHGIFQARIPEWVAISFPRGSSWEAYFWIFNQYPPQRNSQTSLPSAFSLLHLAPPPTCSPLTVLSIALNNSLLTRHGKSET